MKTKKWLIYFFKLDGTIHVSLTFDANQSNITSVAVGPTITNRKKVAIIGLGIRFPAGCHDLNTYWDFLKNGKSAIGKPPAGRLDERKEFIRGFYYLFIYFTPY